ncbi:MAG: gamma-glutamyl-gamma-aminobutyrate hydrolase family protein [Victivallales bacterium]|nr:gamma-glutamyl-gamma-aminobutyrate hydrolase family protein [Victivallales bacterium]
MAGKIGIINIASHRETFENYVHAVEAAGGQAEELVPSAERDEVQRQADSCDAFIFIGGPDFSPERYGGIPHPAIKNLLDDVKEEYCFALSKAVVFERKKPFL